MATSNRRAVFNPMYVTLVTTTNLVDESEVKPERSEVDSWETDHSTTYSL
jgi:hypothetical protein